MSDTDKHPSNVLIEDMNKFVQDITSLYTTLPLIMYITGTMKNENRGKYETLLRSCLKTPCGPPQGSSKRSVRRAFFIG